MKNSIQKLTAILVVLTTIFVSCKKKDSMPDPDAMGPAIDIVGLTASNSLVLFSGSDPSSFKNTVNITGLEGTEQIISIDFRPATGELYGLGSSSRLYAINYQNGRARAIGTTPFSPVFMGATASIDFNPTVDRLRLVTNQGQNLRLNPETGLVVATDGSINGVPGAVITAVAYTNSFAGATATILYDIDFTNGVLYKQDPPNNGGLVRVGTLGVTATGAAGFDISPDNRNAIAVAANNANTTNLFIINLDNGKASKIRTIPGTLIDIAIPTNPTAYAVDGSNNLQIFNPETPGNVIVKPITGLPAGASIEGIDFRPVNGQLYAIGSNSQLYTLNTSNGAASAVGSPFTPLIIGTDFGFDFNPTVDRIRLVSNSGQNLRLNPITGAVAAIDISLNPGTPAVSAVAYTNSFAGTTTTELYSIDHNTDKLYFQNPPNDGVLVERGDLGININSSNGFDIGGNSNRAFAVLTTSAGTGIYSINITTGAASNMKAIGINTVRGFAIAPGF